MKSLQRRDKLTLALNARKLNTTTTSLTSFVSLDSAEVRRIKELSSEQIVVPAARGCSLQVAAAHELNRHCCAIVTTNEINSTFSPITKQIVQSQMQQQRQIVSSHSSWRLQNASLATIITAPKSPSIQTSSSSTTASTNPRPTRLKRNEAHKYAPALGVRQIKRQRSVSSSALIVALTALTCCLTSYTFINQIQASGVSSSSSSANHEGASAELSSSQPARAEHISSSTSALNDERSSGNSANDRIDSFSSESSAGPHGSPMSSALVSSSSSINSDSSSSSQSSIVASLSSAVAQAAAAAAVAAAKNSLSSSDARSLLSHHQGSSSSSSRHHAQQQQTARSPGLHLAMKIADAIPEVPYHILHNMKKLDHAAPFYNVAGSKMIGGKGKESSPSLLATALANLGGIEQLSSLFRSPIWKRIAEGYGEFTSEFRSLFRAPAHTMKGPTSSTSKMIRDISVPALLMLLATTMPSEWRPMRTRRKSLAPVDLATQAISGEQMLASASAPAGVDLPGGFSLSQAAFSRQSPNFGQQQAVASSTGIVPDFSAAAAATTGFQNPLAQLYNQVEQQQQVGQLARVASDIQHQQLSGQPETTNSGNLEASWMSAAASQPASQNLGINVNNNFAAAAQQERQSIRRVGDLASAGRLEAVVGSGLGENQVVDRFAPMSSPDFDKFYSNQQREILLRQENTKPVNEQAANGRLPLVAWQQQQPAPTGLFSSLTSPAGQLMNLIMNANGNFVGQQQQERLDEPPVLMRREQLDEKHKYSLVDDEQSFKGENGNSQPTTGKSQGVPNSLLSAVGQAISGAFNPMKSMSVESDSNRIQARQSSSVLVKPSAFTGSDDQNELNQREINRDQREFPLIRSQQHADVAAPATVGAEVRFFDSISSGETNNNLRDMARKQIQIVLGKLTAMPEATFNKVALAISPKATSPFRSQQAAGSQTTQTQQTLQSPQSAMANLIANAGSNAMKFIGLKNKSFTSASAGGEGSSSSSSTADDSPSAASNNLKNKSDSSSGKGGVATHPSKGKLAGMVNMLVNTLTNRNQQSSSSNAGAQSSESSKTNSSNETQSTNSNSQVSATSGGEA